MINKTMWNIFEETGNIEAFLYINEHDKLYNEQEKNNIISKKELLEIKEITII